MTSNELARQAFDEAVAHTRSLSPATFDTWFAGVQFDDLTDGVLSLRATNEFVQEWVEANFLPALVDKLRTLTQKSIQIAWMLDPKLTRPIASGASSPPVRPRTLLVRPSDAPPPRDDDGPRSERGSDALTPSRGVAARTIGSRPLAVRSLANAVSLEDLNPKQTFASFVVGPSNQLAHAAAVAAAGGGGRRYNPLFICGGTGLGKTHLMQAIAHRMLSDRPTARVLYVSAERFTNEFIHAIQHQRMDEFRARYRTSCDLLLVDDIQFLAGREQTQEEFFHTFNALHGLDRQIVVTSDKYPQNLERMEERLVSRFSWGLVADIQVPELETRVAIVRNKAALEGIALEDDVALLLAQVIRSNVRELEGTLIRLAAKSSLTGRPVDIAFARAELAQTGAHKPQLMSVEDIQRTVCHHFHIRSSDLTSKDRHKTVAFARHVAMYLCKQRLKCSFPELGRAFGGRDHTTVMSAVRKIESQRDTDPQVRAHLEALEKKLADSGS
ncbi:MAG TPA: chromosomal replication initiator protein DnaA [Polyangiaceae bacterium]|nr:chromosomal replication initiator protein DnaA [Polyangiaceae bacterium]